MPGQDEEFAIPDAAALLDGGDSGADGPPHESGSDKPAPDQSDSAAWAALAEHHDALMRLDGVVMVGIGRGDFGQAAIVIGVTRADQLRKLPTSVGGIPLRPQVIGEVDAYAGGGKSRKK